MFGEWGGGSSAETEEACRLCLDLGLKEHGHQLAKRAQIGPSPCWFTLCEMSLLSNRDMNREVP